MINRKQCTIKEFNIFKDGGAWCMSAIVEVETDTEIQTFDLPKIYLTSVNNFVNMRSTASYYHPPETTVDFGFGELQCLIAPNCINITKKTQELTIEEIEKKLGYKVKIVAKK